MHDSDPVLGAVRAAQQQDLPAVEALLKLCNLPTGGLAQHLPGYLVLEDAGQIVASAGLELYGTAALLRSVAVQQDYRNRGLARAMVNQLMKQARSQGVRAVYLLTTTAQQYFRRMGFETMPREAVDPAVTTSAEFGEATRSDRSSASTMPAGLRRGVAQTPTAAAGRRKKGCRDSSGHRWGAAAR